jgi:hypothetical protein
MFDAVVDDGADFDHCSNRGANRNHRLSVVCRGGVTCKSQSKIGFRLHVLVVYRWKNEWRGEKYIEQEWLLGELFYGGGLLQRIWKCGQCVLPEYQCLLCRCISVVDEI